ncbi:MAG TPA: zinc-ribbon and DUF3426 domain-containing protein [Burkholderiaceae bacterium]|nr:zinc-ribbon and DUF3426 domain-containing protein [Burkholderiaceae bacterium]
MSLATRCTSCGTVFRVVQDQLKVSEGWVRCGRCEQVFNALEGLFDLERDTPPGGAGAHFEEVSAAPRDDAPSNQFSAHQIEGDNEDNRPDDPHLVERIDAHLFGKRRAESAPTPSANVSKRDRHEFSDARFDTNLFVDDEEEPLEPGIGGTATDSPEAAAPAKTDHGALDFLRQAQRRAHWQQPRIRFALAAAFALLAMLLALQTALHFRDTVAARWPTTRPLLLSWCDLAGCSIGTPKRIDDIVVDSTALGRLGNDDALRLSVTLRNRGQLPVALPSIDLSLTDTSGQLLARRVLAPRDFQASVAALAPGADIALQAPLSTGSSRVSGFTVEVFYP